MAPGKKSKRTAAQARKTAIRELNRAIEGLNISEDTSQSQTALPPPLSSRRQKLHNTPSLPKVIKRSHLGQRLPIWLHVVDPQNRRITREVKVGLRDVQTIKTVNTFIQSNLGFEIKRAGISTKRTVLVGLVTYGPTTDFSSDTIVRHTQGLFTSDVDYKSWWLGVGDLLKNKGETVKVAAMLWNKREARKKEFKVPPFWNQILDEGTGTLGSEMEKPGWNINLNDLGRGRRGDAGMRGTGGKGPLKRRGDSERKRKDRAKVEEGGSATCAKTQDGDVLMKDAVISED